MGLLSGISDALFGSGDYENPASAAKPYYDKLDKTITPYYQQYIDQGKSAMEDYQKNTQKMLFDPNAFLNNLMGGYQQSPAYKFNLNEALTAGNNAAAAGGMAGSPENQEYNMRLADSLSNKDMMDYLQRVMGVYDQGLQGEQDMYKTGYMANTGLAEQLAAALMNQGNLAYSGAANQNQYNQWQQKNDMDFLGGIGGAFAGSGMGHGLSNFITGLF